MRSDSCDPISIETAVVKLRAGECVGIPTETVYGLAAPIADAHAIEKIFSLKERPFFDPLIVHVSSQSQLKQVVEKIPRLAQKLMDLFWPGPLTIVLPKHASLNEMITSGLPTVGVRMPNHPIALDILKNVGPLAAPSANKFMRVSPTRTEHVFHEFGPEVSVVDGGECSVGIESTVCGFDEKFEKILIYRPGVITQKMLAEIAPVEIKENIIAPGHMKHHYMPKIPLVILTKKLSPSCLDYEQMQSKLNLDNHKGTQSAAILYPAFLRLPATAEIAARVLYSKLRMAECSRDYANCIILPFNLDCSDDSLWASIVNRLTKSATLIV